MEQNGKSVIKSITPNDQLCKYPHVKLHAFTLSQTFIIEKLLLQNKNNAKLPSYMHAMTKIISAQL